MRTSLLVPICATLVLLFLSWRAALIRVGTPAKSLQPQQEDETEASRNPTALAGIPLFDEAVSGISRAAVDRVQRCTPEGRKYLFYGNTFGRHFNQITSFVTAAALARRFGRTLIVPRLKSKGGKAKYPWHLYDMRQLLNSSASPSASSLAVESINENGYCVISDDEFIFARGLTKKRHELHGTACLEMKGVPLIPQHMAQGWGVIKCLRVTPEMKINNKKNFTLLLEKIGQQKVRDAPIVLLPLLIYYAEGLPSAEVVEVWRHIGPHPLVAQAAEAVRNLAQLMSSSNSGAPPLLGLHLRSLEGSCESRVREFFRGRSVEQQRAIAQQCRLDAPYVSKFREPSSSVVIIADDNQQAEKARALADALAPSIRLTDLTFNPSSGSGVSAELFKQRRDAAVQAVQNTRRDPMLSASGPMLVDFWVLVGATSFVGNQLSTLSVNVCRARKSRGQPCNNFF